MTTTELLLSEALEREWEAQGDGETGHGHDAAVRTLLELVLAGAPGGVIAAGRVSGATPEEVVAQVREALPAELSPWTRRSLDRVAALRAPAPSEAVRALPAAGELLPIARSDVPQLPAPAPQAPLVPEPVRPAAGRVGPAFLAAAAGAGIAAAGAAAAVGVLAAAGIGALAGAVLALVLRAPR